jgi:hypothetical protein
MRLAAAKEAADPYSLLFFAPESVEVRFENPLHSASVFAVADKGLKFEPQCAELTFIIPKLRDL